MSMTISVLENWPHNCDILLSKKNILLDPFYAILCD